jgi:hypothetical protein
VSIFCGWPTRQFFDLRQAINYTDEACTANDPARSLGDEVSLRAPCSLLRAPSSPGSREELMRQQHRDSPLLRTILWSRAALLVLMVCCQSLDAQTVVNGGFNTTAGWATANDAVLAHPGGTAPWSWDTPVVSTTIVNATETVLPVEGSGMGLTYAGADSFSQDIVFPVTGNYVFSVDANAITGTVNASPTLVDGQFRFFVAGQTSPDFTVPTGAGWTNYSWTALVTAGSRTVRIQNPLTAPYAIAYDNFTISPEPATGSLLAVAGWTLLSFGCRTRSQTRDLSASPNSGRAVDTLKCRA